MDPFASLTTRLVEFRNERDWGQFHNAKDLALAVSIEAAELNELFLWKKPEEVNLAKVKEELADVFCYCLLLAEKYELSIEQIIHDKIDLNAKKYPVEKARGTAKKYNELE